ncbi:MAG: AsnC family protein [Gammaproteobacteria bacterium]|nr:AsnC family protein [Gammaproteobacteria bacterium]
MSKLSTFEREMKNTSFKKKFDKDYKEFLLSEIMHAMMENDSQSVRKLAKEVGLSPTVIQKLRSGQQVDVKLKNFVNISHACGYNIILEKGNDRIFL